MLHGDLGGVLDLIDVQPVKRRQRCGSHGTGAADLGLTAALGSGDRGIGADHIADESRHRQRVQDFLLGKAPVRMHIVQHRRQHATASAGGSRDYDVLVGVFLADGVSVCGNDAVHRDIRALVVAALFIEELRFALHSQPAGQRALRAQAAPDGILHRFPYGFEVAAQPVVLHTLDETGKIHAALPAYLQNLGEMLLRIDLDLFFRAFPFNADGAAADAEYAPGAQKLSVPEGLKEHGVWVRQITFSAVKHDLRSGQAGQNGLAGPVPLAGKGQGTEERDLIIVSVRVALPEDLRCVKGADGMGAGRSVADFIDALDGFHLRTSLQREFFALFLPLLELSRGGKQHVA